jgi:hypothetical protein
VSILAEIPGETNGKRPVVIEFQIERGNLFVTDKTCLPEKQ